MQLPEGTGSIPEKFIPSFVSFQSTLSRYGIRLKRGRTTTMQVNVGLLCNQTCRHCHLEAGPRRTELMDKKVLDEVAAFAERGRFETIDITGGAPELNPHLVSIIEGLAPLAHNFMVRTNLSALEKVDTNRLISVFRDHGVVLVASFPSLNQSQTDSQRGKNIFQTSISMLRRLNAFGYGLEGTGLELNLVSNPTGAFLPASQPQTEMRFRQVLEKKWGIFFNQIFNFANVPLGRFRQWLLQSGNFETYIQKLVSTFNPCAIEGLMCRRLISISWEGYLYDCDFNLAEGIFMGGRKKHVSEMVGPPEQGSPIATADHCYTCTAGAGFT
jgi:radical SAM/Cys-rich protein